MTAQTTVHDATRRIFAGVGTAITAIGETIANASQAARCAREAERLFALSDLELARRGLARDQIIQHAFRRYLHL